MATLTSAFDTNFVPAVGDFIVEVTGVVRLMRKNTAASPVWSTLIELSPQDRKHGSAVIVSNPVAGAVYRFEPMAPGSTAQADQ